MRPEMELSLDREEGFIKVVTAKSVTLLRPESARKMAFYLNQIADESEELLPGKFPSREELMKQREGKMEQLRQAERHRKGLDCEHKWKRQSAWSSPEKGKIQRHKCELCRIWGYSNPPHRINPAPYVGPITEPQKDWERGIEDELSMQFIPDECNPPDDFERRDKPIGWSPPKDWTDLE